MPPPTDRPGRRAAIALAAPLLRPDSGVTMPITDWGRALDAAEATVDATIRARLLRAVALEMYTACCALRAQVDMREARDG